MPPTLILIRHAEALHNVDKDYSIPDPVLSQLGLQQCTELRDHLRQGKERPQVSELAERAELIVVSPMRRTLQTALLGLDWLVEKGVPLRPDAGWQENSDKPCDTGSPVSVLQKEFPSVDFQTVDPIYPEKVEPATNPYAFSRRAVVARGQTCLEWLHKRPEKVIVVVSHSGFLRCSVSQRRYANADYRVFDFEERKGDGAYRLREWEITESGGMGKSERGTAVITETDFPREEQLGEATQEVPN
ncbi:Histidine phosphatase superfamily clade-1 [Lasiodiplodia theobromae]|uniref:Histidine phosphatase superfamily clade-1 n=1 Tax=Lasiodiplodia theobromae TaxID=45133 RepID=A0A5N5D1X2_9PEZI|nr:Phosphoglycerate mutase [Lasiodiplodia theobromae]KAB2571557.1 putative phosphatase [Lasiodiplodia theobromae]KAF4534811.1 Phosphoglycerate mutase [Lasiodiplodia theobromae]KAF9629956.1 Histidine phosphatase superfamily clade-1 [Lasiodiplodia theobromae]